MRAEHLRFRDLRNHVSTEIRELASRINVFAGPNGAGKTSTLEALSLSTISKSFSSSTDSVLVRSGAQGLAVEAEFKSDLDTPYRVSVDLTLGPPAKKSLEMNGERLRSAAELIGRTPVVVLTPDDKAITGGAPQERRRFLNMVLSQASRSYLKDETEFKRALKQRNAILHEGRLQKRPHAITLSLLEPWTELIVQHGSRVMRRRASFVEEFRAHLLAAYRTISSELETPSLSYLPLGHIGVDARGDFEQIFRGELEAKAAEELRRAATVVGPHRDELLIEIDPGREAKHYASQGQHKSLLVAMKLAEFTYLKEASGETPMLLLDDVFSELDKKRASLLLEMAQADTLGQTFITSTDKDFFSRTLSFSGSKNAIFTVQRGEVQRMAALAA